MAEADDKPPMSVTRTLAPAKKFECRLISWWQQPVNLARLYGRLRAGVNGSPRSEPIARRRVRFIGWTTFTSLQITRLRNVHISPTQLTSFQIEKWHASLRGGCCQDIGRPDPISRETAHCGRLGIVTAQLLNASGFVRT